MVKNTKRVKTVKKASKIKPSSVKKAKVKGVKGLLRNLDKKFIIGSALILVVAAFLGWRFLPSIAAESVLWSSGVPVTLANEDLGSTTSWHNICAARYHGTTSNITLLT